MNDDDLFLHQLREEPRPAFLRDLRRRLERIEREVEGPKPQRSLRTLLVGILIGASAMALAAVALNERFPGVHAFLQSHGLAPGGGVETANQDGGVATEDGLSRQPGGGGVNSLQNAWTTIPGAARQAQADKRPTQGPSTIVTVPSATAGGTTTATPANYGVGTVGIGQGPRTVPLLVGTRAVSRFAQGAVERYAGGILDLLRTERTPKLVLENAAVAFAQFCTGDRLDSPDMVYSERMINRTESEACNAKWGADNVRSLLFGYEALVLVRSHLSGPLNRTPRQMFLALAAEVPDPSGGTRLVPNPYRTWNQIEGVADTQRIEVSGPPLTSTSGEAFLALMLEKGCDSFAWIAALRAADPKRHEGICRTVRQDGVYSELGSQGRTPIDDRLESEPGALGVMGLGTYRGLVRFGGAVDLGTMSGVTPSDATILDETYPASRPLYLYVNASRLVSVRDLAAFLAMGPVLLSGGVGGRSDQLEAVIAPAQTQREYREALDQLIKGR